MGVGGVCVCGGGGAAVVGMLCVGGLNPLTGRRLAGSNSVVLCRRVSTPCLLLSPPGEEARPQLLDRRLYLCEVETKAVLAKTNNVYPNFVAVIFYTIYSGTKT